MLARVLETISRYNMLPAGSRVIVAVSGGADSVCLLHVLKELFPASVAGIAHFNHKWRPQASDDDERFVSALACRHALPFFRAEAVASQGNREQEARRARQHFFSSLNTTVALGHTRDDQAETVLFRLLRGSGLTGLAAIPPVSNGIIRPLIGVTRAQIEQYLQDRHIPWREDSTNQDRTFARNRIRHELLPQLARDWNPKITDALANLADLAQEEESYWETEIDRLAALELIVTPNAVELHASLLNPDRHCGPSLQACRVDSPVDVTHSKAAARRLIRRAIAHAKGNLRQIDYNHIESVFNLKRTLHLPGLTVTKSFDWLRFSVNLAPQPSPPQQITAPGIYPSPDGLSKICVDAAHIDRDPAANACATLGMEACWFQSCSPLVLRGWRPGDHYRPAGHSRDHKVQEMFQKARVPSWRRASWPILTSEDKILWSRQFGVAHECTAPGDKRVQVCIRELI